jgi:hypothetical protein
VSCIPCRSDLSFSRKKREGKLGFAHVARRPILLRMERFVVAAKVSHLIWFHGFQIEIF